MLLFISVGIFRFFFSSQRTYSNDVKHALHLYNEGENMKCLLCNAILGCRYKFIVISTMEYSEFCFKMECVCVKYGGEAFLFPRTLTWNSSTVEGDDLTESLALEGSWAGLPTWAGLQVGVWNERKLEHWANAHFSCTLPKHKLFEGSEWCQKCDIFTFVSYCLLSLEAFLECH